MTRDECYEVACEILGPSGRMISGSKSGYRQAHPDGNPVFNANLIADGIGKVWYGDLDLVRDDKKLQQVAVKTGHKFYVLREHDARFMNESNPQIQNAVALILGDVPAGLVGKEK